MTRIALPPRKTDEELDRLARQMLATGNADQDDDVIDLAVKIAYEERLEVEFVMPNGNPLATDVAYRLRYERGIRIR